MNGVTIKQCCLHVLRNNIEHVLKFDILYFVKVNNVENLVHMPEDEDVVYLCMNTLHLSEHQLQLLSPIIIMPRSGEWASTAEEDR